MARLVLTSEALPVPQSRGCGGQLFLKRHCTRFTPARESLVESQANRGFSFWLNPSEASSKETEQNRTERRKSATTRTTCVWPRSIKFVDRVCETETHSLKSATIFRKLSTCQLLGRGIAGKECTMAFFFFLHCISQERQSLSPKLSLN